MADSDGLSARKLKHIDACRTLPVAFQTVRTGFAEVVLPYRALPDTDLSAIDTTTTLLGRTLRAPVLIGAMTGGAELAGTINRNLAIAAEAVGVGLMLGSQRVMLERPEHTASFQVREHAPHALVIGNLGVAQLNRGYTAEHVDRAVDTIGADAIALHTNPLQEALQEGGDTDFRDIAARIRAVTSAARAPVLLKEVGHGIGGATARTLVDVGLAAIDVAGAGGTSWARVEEYVRYGEIRHPDLVEWGIPTATALAEVRAAMPDTPVIASGGIRSGMDAAKALAAGAQAVAVAQPLLGPATTSAEAVVAWLEDFVAQLRVAMHGTGAPTVAALRARAGA